MTTPRDLLITTLGMASGDLPGQGDLSLALAGAELIDLLNAGVATLEDDRVVPGETVPGEDGAISDRLLNEASSALTRQAPYETVEDWLWRRGGGLAAEYLAALRSEGLITQRRRSRWIPFGTSRLVLTVSPARRSALDRWTSNEPVLASLGTALRIRDEPEGPPGAADEPTAAVLAAVHNALRDLEAERQRRSIEQAAFDNIWRGE
ncbi:GOLPH3/VPS74 family protein [Streptomyces sp. NBC_01716]|uniref:GOLPH3/VPS74 family protein n=1 Tax=Streptomyces sp. NBC_01716 TaxID=2975917 RepID=UPI002E37003F|nr:GPP34 family phosphoprotein [Streptomyces sp. NBC_01716]